jgi:hypothetical protein
MDFPFCSVWTREKRILQHLEPFLGNGSGNTFPRQRIPMEQYRYSSKRCFLLGPCKGFIIMKIEARPDLSTERAPEIKKKPATVLTVIKIWS